MNLSELQSALSSRRFDDVEASFKEALADADLSAQADFLLAACRGLARVAGQKARLQSLAGQADTVLRKAATTPALGKLRWELLKEAVRAGATPSTSDGFHRFFEDALGAAHPECPSLEALLGRFRFRETKTTAEGLARLEKVERWLPFEVGRVFLMPGRGAGRVVETNFQLDAVRVDFEKAKGVSVPIGVAARQMEALPPGHFLREKLSDPKALAATVESDPSGAIRLLLESFGRNMTMAEVKEAFSGLVPDEKWNSFWTSARKNPRVVVHGTGRGALVEWTASAEEADDKLLAKFEKSPLREQLDFFRRHAKRSPELTEKLAKTLAAEARSLAATEPALAFDVALTVEKTTGTSAGLDLDALVPESPLPFIARLEERAARERALDAVTRRDPAGAPKVLAEWFFKEDDKTRLNAIDRQLTEADPALREQVLDRLLKNPRQGPRAFLWFAEKACEDDTFRARLGPSVLGRMLDAVTWDEMGPGRTKLREMFDRTGLAAAWLVKQATAEEAGAFLEVLGRHHDLEPHRVRALVSAAEMRFPELRKKNEEVFFATPEAIELRRQELDQIMKVEMPENTKGIAAAAAEGDLSENFEYKARRERQQLLSARAGKLQEDLARARALDPSTVDPSEIRPGTRVILKTAVTRRTVTLLGPWDSKPEEGIYSYQADLGQSLLGRKVGEEAEFLGQRVLIESIEVWR